MAQSKPKNRQRGSEALTTRKQHMRFCLLDDAYHAFVVLPKKRDDALV